MSYTDEFVKKRFKEDDIWMRDNLIMECVMGSQAYGVANKDSDIDIVGIVMNPHMHLFPQKYGYINGFNKAPLFTNKDYKGEKNRIILDNDKDCEGEWHSLSEFFYLAGVKGSPNLMEVLFVRRPLVTFADDKGITWMLRDNRHMFLSQRSFLALKGYANQQLMRIKRGIDRWDKEKKCDNSKRKVYLEKYGFDIKQAYHPLRLLDNIHQILTEGDIDLMRNKDECLRMRAGQWGTFKEFEKYVTDKIIKLEDLALKPNKLSIKPQTQSLQQLLMDCIEEWYGSEEGYQQVQGEYVSVKELREHLNRIESKVDDFKCCGGYGPAS